MLNKLLEELASAQRMVERWNTTGAIPQIERDIALGNLQKIYQEVLNLEASGEPDDTDLDDENEDDFEVEIVVYDASDDGEEEEIEEDQDGISADSTISIVDESNVGTAVHSDTYDPEYSADQDETDQEVLSAEESAEDQVEFVVYQSSDEEDEDEEQEEQDQEKWDEEEFDEESVEIVHEEEIEDANIPKIDEHSHIEVLFEPEFTQDSTPKSEETAETLKTKTHTETAAEDHFDDKHQELFGSAGEEHPKEKNEKNAMLLFGQMVPREKIDLFVRDLFLYEEQFFKAEVAKISVLPNLDSALIYISEKYNWNADSQAAEEFAALLANYNFEELDRMRNPELPL